MPPPIRVNFQVGGVASVDQALRSVEQSTARVEKISKRAYDDDVRAAKKASAEKEREFAKLGKWVEQQRMKELRDANKLATDELKVTEKSAAAKLKAEEKWAAQRQQIQITSAKIAYRIAEDEVRDVERAEEKKNQVRQRFARGMGRTIGGSLTSLAGTAARVGGSLLALGGGFGIADAVQKQFSLEHEAALFSNQSSTTGQRVATKDIMAKARAVAMENGVDATDVARGMTGYFAKASDAPGAMANADLFAKLSKATGADMVQLATVAGQLKVQNPSLDDKQMRNMMLGIVGQTRHGAVDMVDLAAHVPVITGSAVMYGGDQALNQRKLIGLSQVAMRTAGDSAEAATAVQHFGLDVAGNADKMKKAGITVKDKNGGLKDPSEIIADIMEKTHGDIGKIKDLGIGDRSIRLFTASLGTYKSGGRDAVAKDIAQFTNGGYDEKGLAADVANVQAGSGERFHKAVDRVSEIIQERLAPYLERFADRLPELEPKIGAAIDAFQSIADAFIDHPIAGVGAIIALQVGKDVAAAQIGNVIAAGIARALGVSAGSGAAAGAGSAAGGAGGGGVSAIGVVAGAVAMGNSMRNTVADTSAGAKIEADLRSGKITPEQAQKMVNDAKATNAGTSAKDILPSAARSLGVDFLGGDDFSAKGKKLHESQAIAHDSSLQKLITELQNNTAAVKANGGTANPSNPNRNAPISAAPRGGTQ